MASLGYRDPERGKFHIWAEDNQEYVRKMMPLVGEDLFSASYMIHDATIEKFLSDNEKKYDDEKIEKIFGWSKADDYCENLFKIIEEQTCW